MSDRPTNKEIADALGITENEAGTYAIQFDSLGKPNAWLVIFAVEMPPDLRKKLKRKGMNDALVCPVLIPPKHPAQ
jgi:hypothetical protein